MENTIYYTYNPVDFIYTGTITDELGLPFYATNIPPLPKIDYFTSKFNIEEQKWFYVEAPVNPLLQNNPLDKILTYVDCRILDYPKMEDYIDGIVKNDEEQVNDYLVKCLAVKNKWPKTMEPITLREYYKLKYNID